MKITVTCRLPFFEVGVKLPEADVRDTLSLACLPFDDIDLRGRAAVRERNPTDRGVIERSDLHFAAVGTVVIGIRVL